MQENATEDSETSDHLSLYIRGSVSWSADTVMGGLESGALTTSDSKLKDLNVQFQCGRMTLIARRFGSGKTLMLYGLLREAQLLQGEISYVKSDFIPSTEQVGVD